MVATRQNGVHKSERVYCTNSRLYNEYNPGDVPRVSSIQSVSSLIIITLLTFLYNYSIRYIYLLIKLKSTYLYGNVNPKQLLLDTISYSSARWRLPVELNCHQASSNTANPLKVIMNPTDGKVESLRIFSATEPFICVIYFGGTATTSLFALTI